MCDTTENIPDTITCSTDISPTALAVFLAVLADDMRTRIVECGYCPHPSCVVWG